MTSRLRRKYTRSLKKRTFAVLAPVIRWLKEDEDLFGRSDVFYRNVAKTLDGTVTVIDPFEMARRALAILRPLRPYSVQGVAKIRLGSDGDGGYVCLDDFENVRVAHSLGIGNNDTLDVELANKGIDVRQYDGTIKAAPSTHPNLHFFREMIATEDSPGNRSMSSLIRETGGEATDLFLKIDIEGFEWPAFDATPIEEISKYRQIVTELHGFERLAETDQYEIMQRVLDKLNQAFFVCHVHANNISGLSNYGSVVVPQTLEVTFANRALFTPVDDRRTFPTELDHPCTVERPDITLGTFWY